MTTFRWPSGLDPWLGFRGLQRELNRLLNLPSSEGYPPVNVYDTEQAYVVEALLPGVEGKDIDLSITRSSLTVKGERQADEPGEKAACHRQERRVGSFVRSIELPEKVDADKASASYEHGVLTVTLPKAPEAKPKQITVKA